MLKQFTRALAAATRARLCPYLVADSYGTYKPVWSRAEALQWLPACSPVAAVIHRRTGTTLAARMLEPQR